MGETRTIEQRVPRCKHPRAKVVELCWMMHTAKIVCDDCDLVLYAPREPWRSRHACHRVHQAPKWAQPLIDSARLKRIEVLMEQDPPMETPEGRELNLLVSEQVEAERDGRV